MITDAERKAALLALNTLVANLGRISARADGNYNANDFLWAIKESIKELEDNESLNEGSLHS